MVWTDARDRKKQGTHLTTKLHFKTVFKNYKWVKYFWMLIPINFKAKDRTYKLKIDMLKRVKIEEMTD